LVEERRGRKKTESQKEKKENRVQRCIYCTCQTSTQFKEKKKTHTHTKHIIIFFTFENMLETWYLTHFLHYEYFKHVSLQNFLKP